MRSNLFFVLVFFIFAAMFSISSNEVGANSEKKDLLITFNTQKILEESFNSLIDNSDPFYNTNITKYALTGSQSQKLYLTLALVGTAFLGTSLFFIGPGITMIVVSVVQYKAPYEFRSYISNDAGYNLYIAGIAFLTSGAVMMFGIGLPLTIAGFVLYSYYGGKFSMFMETKEKRSNFGLAVKI